MSSPRTAVMLALLLAAAHSTLAAQDSTHRVGNFLVGAGLNLSRDVRPAVGVPLAFQAGYEWSQRGSPLAFRLSADYDASGTRAAPIGFAYQQAGTLSTHTRDVALGLAGTFALHGGRLEPYLLSGVALQRRSLDYVLASSAVREKFSSTEYSAGLQAGLGLRAHLLSTTVFMEARTYVPAFGGVEQRRVSTNPLTFGLRF